MNFDLGYNADLSTYWFMSFPWANLSITAVSFGSTPTGSLLMSRSSTFAWRAHLQVCPAILSEASAPFLARLVGAEHPAPAVERSWMLNRMERHSSDKAPLE